MSDLDTDDNAPRNARFSDTTPDDVAEVIPSRAERRKTAERAEREGLPPGYRMRADAHYVEQLSARSQDVPMRLVPTDDIDAPEPAAHFDAGALQPLVRSIAEHGLVQPLLVRRDGDRYRLIAGRHRLAAARAAGVLRVPCLVHTADEAQADALGRAAAVRVTTTNEAPAAVHGSTVDAHVIALASQALGTIAATARLLGDGSPTAHRVGVNLVRAEAWRAAWQLRAATILDNAHRWRFRPVFIGDLLTRVRDGFAAEGRLAEIDLRFDVVDWNASADLDEDAVICAISGVVVATAGLMDAGDAAPIAIAARRSEGRSVTIEVTQSAVVADIGSVPRFFDLSWLDRPGGAAAAIGAAAARAVAARHGGDATFVAAAAAGSSVRLTFGLPAEKERRAH